MQFSLDNISTGLIVFMCERQALSAILFLRCDLDEEFVLWLCVPVVIIWTVLD